MSENEEPIEDDEIELVSKTQLKRESLALRDLGATLVALSDQQLKRMPLPENIAAAVSEARRIKKHGALKRQLQYLGKLLRHSDPEPIRLALERLEEGHIEDRARFHRIEQWRDRLLSEGDSALGELVAEHPAVDRQHLRQLLRKAEKERKAEKPPATARVIFKYLRQLIATD
ncbi:hypothetical protein BOW53_12890 [Solemya pervernicosa gill symbiont]|uniref:Dual-action ribosomal maturation protein DarP n=2 Tax=Gammaproteobacteria incertae sedis TaxID=118884 RepID=A0A1T2L218_9GAMM|nr:ribosome biogenesis factor YjgA [Candidatus Reidiella endopervernicosa]OOZ39104.1 hypothetical protein BOW53_12890 [Solemya pervernicosa gill symbiont]QKQ26732.1 ribosome-associated protein [Candidatus Reidiella endopervernicosa]